MALPHFQPRQPSGAPTGGQFATTARPESPVALTGPALTESEIADVESDHDAMDPPGSATYWQTMERVFAAARQSAADRATLNGVAQLVETATRPGTDGDQAKAMLARIRTALAAAGHLPQSEPDARAGRRIEAPFAGTDLDWSPALAASHLQLQGTGDRYALILNDRMLSPTTHRAEHPAILAADGDGVEVWLGTERLAGSAQDIVWRRVAAGTDQSAQRVKEAVEDRIVAANEALTA